jgi:NADH-quinone oxidoreductase subunit D
MATSQTIKFREPASRVAEGAKSLLPTPAPAGPPLSDDAGELQGEKMVLNMGPSHPSTHGVLRIVLELDGEIITKATPDVGYLHRGDEKIAENMTWNQFIPYTDRLDYLAPLANNVAYALAVEKLLGIEKQLPPRCQYIRVICCEMARISAHLLGLGAFAMDIGALTRSSCTRSPNGRRFTRSSSGLPARGSRRATRASAGFRATCRRAGRMLCASSATRWK